MKKTIFTIMMSTSVLMITAMGSTYAEGKHAGGHGAGAHWMSPKVAADKPNPIKRDAASIDRGKKSYFQNCASCHGATAMGDGPVGVSLNPKPTNLLAMSGGHPDGDFAWKISNGRGAMPAWKSVLSEAQIWDLVNYIQNLNPKGKLMDMSKMDHSNMSKEDMKKMMSGMEHSNTNDHHKEEKPKAKSHQDDGEHSH